MSTKKPVILIADDDPEILTMLGIRLSKKGYQVLEAVDGNQTLDLAHKHHPDLVLLDVMMPGRNGWEVAKELRADDEFSNVGIVMLTAGAAGAAAAGTTAAACRRRVMADVVAAERLRLAPGVAVIDLDLAAGAAHRFGLVGGAVPQRVGVIAIAVTAEPLHVLAPLPVV